MTAFDAGEIERDVVVVVRFQGPKANGMPEPHKLTPSLGVLQDRGFKVALVTDGRIPGASGKVPAAKARRDAPPPPPFGTGRELFAFMRRGADGAERGTSAMLAAAGP